MKTRAALYARFSTEKQRDASIDDQFRECERVAAAAGLQVVARFEDRGLSGGTHQRPGYQALLAAARRHEFDVIVTEDISRLWRSRAEFGPRSAELEDLGIDWLSCVGQDTRRDGWGLVIQVLQAMAEQARREASYRTRRGLAGKALAGKSTGAKAYGYIAARESQTGNVEIDPLQAAVVVRIFEQYAAGMGPRGIAGALNAEGVPSPGASWKRITRRKDAKWVSSALHGDPARGSGILNNRRYLGVVAWGATEWRRSAADSSIRRRRAPEQPAIERTEERLRIVSDELWGRVQARRSARASDLGVRVKRGLRQRLRPAKYLLSGLLRCHACRATFVMTNGARYQCASHSNGGNAACSVAQSVLRERIESVVLEFMVGPELPRHLDTLEAQLAAAEPVQIDHRPRIAELERQRRNLIEAIKGGGLASELAGELRAVTAELERLQGLQGAARPAATRPGRATTASRLEVILERLRAGGELAQAAVREVFPGGIWLFADPDGGPLQAVAQTALEHPAGLVDAAGRSLPEGFPRVYSSLAEDPPRAAKKVGVSGSGGVSLDMPTGLIHFSLEA